MKQDHFFLPFFEKRNGVIVDSHSSYLMLGQPSFRRRVKKLQPIREASRQPKQILIFLEQEKEEPKLKLKARPLRLPEISRQLTEEGEPSLSQKGKLKQLIDFHYKKIADSSRKAKTII